MGANRSHSKNFNKVHSPLTHYTYISSESVDLITREVKEADSMRFSKKDIRKGFY